MSEEITITTTNEENLKPTATREDFLNYVAVYHHKKSGDLQTLIDKNDWTMMQRVFGPRDLIRIAKDQKILQVKNGFDLMNKCDQIVNDVILGSLKNRAQALLTIDAIHQGREIIKATTYELETLIKDLDVSRKRFVDYIVEKEKDLKNYKDSELAYQQYYDSVKQESEAYFNSRKKQLESIETKIRNIEAKYGK